MTIGTASSCQQGRLGLSFSTIAATLFMVLISLGFSLLPERAEAQNYRFTSVTVEGNHRIEPAAIMGYAGIARGQVVTAGELNDAYQRIVGSGLFETVDLQPRGGNLLIKVTEFPTINVISFEGNKRLKDEVLTEIVQSQSRRVFNPKVVERDTANINKAYAESGRLAARVTPRIIRRSDNRVDLVFEIFEGGEVEIERISFVGNEKFSDRRLRRVLESKQAGIFRMLVKRDTLVEDRIQFDKQVLHDFYMSRGYVDFRTTSVNAELARARDGYFITFNVQEGDQFRFGEITTVSELAQADADEFQAALKIKPGAVYSPAQVENSIARMERLAIRKGIDFLRVEPRVTRDDRNLLLNVEFVLTKGPRVFVERIDIEGNATTLDRVVRQQFRIVEGDPFNPREIRESAERIRALQFFETAEVNAREGSTPDQVVVDVDVVEQPTGSLSFGGAYSTASGFGLILEFNERNFLGRGQNLSFALSTASETKDYHLGFAEPRFLGRDLEFGFGLTYRDIDYDAARYETTVGDFEPYFAFPMGQHSRFALRYKLNTTDMEVPAAQAIAGSLIDAEAARGELWSSGLGYTYTYDPRKTGLSRTTGVLLEFSQDFTGVGGDVEAVTTTVRAVAETKVYNEEITLRATIQGGALYSPDNDSRTPNRFQIGGNIMRGFDRLGIGPREYVAGTQNDSLGGKYYAVARLEAEFPIGLPEEYGISGGLFYDVGSLWGVDATSANTLYSDAELRQVIGATIFWNTVVGPLRFDFTHALQKEAFDDEQKFNLSIHTKF